MKRANNSLAAVGKAIILTHSAVNTARVGQGKTHTRGGVFRNRKCTKGGNLHILRSLGVSRPVTRKEAGAFYGANQNIPTKLLVNNTFNKTYNGLFAIPPRISFTLVPFFWHRGTLSVCADFKLPDMMHVLVKCLSSVDRDRHTHFFSNE